jgi:hypothetical protein
MPMKGHGLHAVVGHVLMNGQIRFAEGFLRHPSSRRRPALARIPPRAGRSAPPPPHRFFEASYRLRVFHGTPRAPLSQSSPLSREALGGTGLAKAGGDCRQRDSFRGSPAAGGDGALTGCKGLGRGFKYC